MSKNVITFVCIFFAFFVSFFIGSINVNAATTTVYTINESPVNFRTGPGTDYDVVLSGFYFYDGDVVTYLGTANDINGALWYKVSYVYSGTTYTGYVYGTYVTSTTYNITTDAEFEAYLTAQGFPTTYWPKLKELHALHPNWVFQALKTNLDWNTAVAAESVVGKSLISASRDVSYRSTEYGSYNWDTDTWKALDSTTWFAANSTVVGYYMDPRNFLTLSNIFMFESLSYNSAVHTESVVQGILNGTFMEKNTYVYNGSNKTYASTFMNAATATKVSPVHLASRARQEQGTTIGRAVSGAYITCYSNKYNINYAGSNMYNFFNIGATSGTDPVCNGLVYAAGSNAGATTYSRPWNNQYKSIIGGATIIGDSYINKGQNTIYLERFNVNPSATNSAYTHQYMTNIEAPKSESSTTYSSYSSFSALNNAFVFIIPVYNSMPASTSLPTLLGNPNNYLNSLTINGTSVPSFSRTNQSYTINVPASVTSLTIAATKISSLATITSGTGIIELTGASTAININVKAGNGTIRTYTITVNKSDTNPLTTDELLISLKMVNNSSILTGVPVNSTVSSLTSSVTKANYLATIVVKDKNGTVKTSGNIATGDTIAITNNGKTSTYTICIYGDVNGDGVINIRDLLAVQKSILKVSTLTGNYLKAADPNKDGSVTIRDLLAVQKHILGSSLIVQ